jgi:hypothetical protein
VSRLRPDPTGEREWIEITNAGDAPIQLYDLADLSQSWLMVGVMYAFEAGITLQPHEHLLVTNSDPIELCAAGLAPSGWRVTGPYALNLGASGQEVLLLRPMVVTGRTALGTLDTVGEFGASASGSGFWERTAPTAYGHDPESWRWIPGDLPATTAATDGAPVPQLCSFEAVMNEQRKLELRWVTHHPELVRDYSLWRGTDGQREHAQLLRAGLTPAGGAQETWIDEDADPTQLHVYWLEATDTLSQTVALGMTTPQRPIHLLYVPFIAR